MKYRDNPALQQKLAAEYALGTLRGPARARFQTWMRDDAALRALVAEWEERLAPLAGAVEAVDPPQRVWRALEARVDALAARATPASAGWWNSLAFWRSWGLIATGFAVAVLTTVTLAPGRFDSAPVALDNRMQPSYIAVLHGTGPKNEPMFMAYAGRTADQLWIKRMALPDAPDTHSYELWAMPAREGEPPRSLGVIPPVAKGTMQLVAMADTTLKDVPSLAITVEPAGGSTTGQPTGPMIAKGRCFNFW